jgi:hypothetical protein
MDEAFMNLIKIKMVYFLFKETMLHKRKRERAAP